MKNRLKQATAEERKALITNVVDTKLCGEWDTLNQEKALILIYLLDGKRMGHKSCIVRPPATGLEPSTTSSRAI